MLSAAGMPKMLFDFTEPNSADGWRAIDDRVMGGVSRSTLRRDSGGHAVFEGEVSLERNGGFASVRANPGDRGLAGAETCVIEVRGDPKQFKLSLLTDDGFDGVNFQASSICRWLGSAPASADASFPTHRRSTLRASAKSA
jgi:NADH dehydrogenase [ubiquinone] 1 alpha subcomplex assembly factor 1